VERGFVEYLTASERNTAHTRHIIRKGGKSMLLAALIVLLLWLLGFSFHIAGGFIHLLLIIGVIMLIVHLLNGRRAPTV
jgi:hypothetical protein